MLQRVQNAVRRNPAVVAIVATLLAAWVVGRWMARRHREGKASGPETCAKNKYWDAANGKCMKPRNCTSKGGKVEGGACVGCNCCRPGSNEPR